MYQLNTRSATANFKKENQEDFDEVNAKLALFQQKTGIEYLSFKDLFLALIDQSLLISAEKTEELIEKLADVEPEKPADNPYVITVADNLPDWQQFQTRLLNLHEIQVGGDEKPSMIEAINLALEIAELPNESEVIEKEVVKEIPLEIGENQLLITVLADPKKPIDKKFMILDLVSKNRYGKGKSNHLETREEIVQLLAFSGGALFNSEGDTYTGI